MTANMQPQQTAGHGISGAVQKLAETDRESARLLAGAVFDACGIDGLRALSFAEREILRDLLRGRIEARERRETPSWSVFGYSPVSSRRKNSPLGEVADCFAQAGDYLRLGMLEFEKTRAP